jgi:hypothetical protein
VDRALAAEHLRAAFGDVQLSQLPTVDELTGLLADLEIELVRGLAATGYNTDLTRLRQSAWYLHGIASTAEESRYPLAQRNRAFAVSAHVLDLLLSDPAEVGTSRLNTAFAAQVGYHRADQSPNAAAIRRRLRDDDVPVPAFTDGGDVALHAGILFLGMEVAALSQQLRAWDTAARALTVGIQLATLDGTMFGPTQRLLRGINGLVAYLREGDTAVLDTARGHLDLVVRDEVGLSDLDTRWVASHLLALADGLGVNSVWAVLPPDLPAAVKQAFTLDRNPVLTLWPPQRKLIADSANGPLNPDTARLLVSVPTSAGKTLLAQLIICAHTAQAAGDVCYVTPLRSLGREMRQALRSRLRYLDRRLGADLPDGLGNQDLLAGGDDDGDGPVLPQVEVMTPERLMNALRQSPHEVLDRFSLFIIDEVHLIAQSGGRGLLLEGLLSVLDASGARLMLLSGVIGNAASLAAWAAQGHGDVLFTDDWRAPRRLHVLMTTEKILSSQQVVSGRRRNALPKTRYDLRAKLSVRPTSATQKELVTPDGSPIGQLVLRANQRVTGQGGTTPAYATTARTAALLLRAGSLLMVVTQRTQARDAAKVMADMLDDEPRAQGLADALAVRLGPAHPLIGCVRKGVGYHHAGLPVEVQEAVEDAIRDETLKAVVATSTLTDGVNLPVRTVVIATTQYEGQDPGQRMTPAQLLNAVGRAGRAGKESEGWIVLSLPKTLQDTDFAKLTPAASELEVRSTLADENALVALAEAEVLIAQTQDAILRIPHDSEPGGFINYVWFVMHALELVPDLDATENWRNIVSRLFAFTQLDDDLKARWLALAEKVADQYAQTAVASRRRWAQAGTSLGSAATIETIARDVVHRVEQLGGVGELPLDVTLDVLADLDVYARLLELPEAAKHWRFRTTLRGVPLDVPAAGVVRDWVAGRDFAALAEAHLGQVQDPVFRLEQMVDGVSEGVQHYLSWTVGLVVSQANEVLLARLSPGQLYPSTAAHLRYGVDTPLAIELLVRDVKNRGLARDLGRIARDAGLDAGGLRELLSEQHIRGWRENLNASPTDVLDLLAYVQGDDRHKLGELMSTGSVTAQVRPGDVDVPTEAAPVTIVESDAKDELLVLDERRTVLGVIAARDHAGVQAVLESGLLVDVTLEGAVVTLTRAAAGQLSFTS